MAGYLITLNDENALENIVKKGVFSTIMGSPSTSQWGKHHEGTFADYLSMKEGDLEKLRPHYPTPFLFQKK